MRALPATVCLLLVGCAGLVVQPAQTSKKLEVLWDTEIFTNRLEVEWASVDMIPYQVFEFGRRSDGVVVWRTNSLAANEAEAWRLWRAYQDQLLRQHNIDKGTLIQATYE